MTEVAILSCALLTIVNIQNESVLLAKPNSAKNNIPRKCTNDSIALILKLFGFWTHSIHFQFLVVSYSVLNFNIILLSVYTQRECNSMWILELVSNRRISPFLIVYHVDWTNGFIAIICNFKNSHFKSVSQAWFDNEVTIKTVFLIKRNMTAKKNKM